MDVNVKGWEPFAAVPVRFTSHRWVEAASVALWAAGKSRQAWRVRGRLIQEVDPPTYVWTAEPTNRTAPTAATPTQ